MFSNTFIRMMNTTNRITANGMNGGQVQLFASSNFCNAMVINSTINAVGFNGEGGFVGLFSEGGATFQDGQLRVAAIGTRSSGAVVIQAGSFVNPNPPQTQPPAQVNVDGGICFID